MYLAMADRVRRPLERKFSTRTFMSRSHAVLKFIRQVHLYIGIFTTPALLFFAITGALQTFSLHEQTRGSDYKPPAILAELGQLHKKQTTMVPVRRPQSFGPDKGPEKGADRGPDRAPSGAGQASKRPDSAPPPAQPPATQKSHLPMKIFFLLVSISLVTSTLTGLYLSYKYSRGWILITGLLAAGLVIPALLLSF
jgi:hypothetical protein